MPIAWPPMSIPTRRRGVPHLAAALTAGGLIALGAASSTGSAAVEVGVYQDDPVKTVPGLARRVGGKGTRVISVYVTAGRRLDPSIVRLARQRRARLLITWLPDSGRAGSNQPRFRNRNVARGKFDRSLTRLARQVRGLRPAPIIRPMPEPNTPWYAWSGTVNKNNPATYVAAWKRVRRAVRRGGGSRVKLMWAPYHRSVPDIETNEIQDYFPGARQVDLVGASGYNFGTTGGLGWTDPQPLFEDAYRQITALAPKPFWIAETGSTRKGGNKAQWMGKLARVRADFPLLKGIVWYDVKDRNGDFRIRQSAATTRAFKAFLKRVRAR